MSNTNQLSNTANQPLGFAFEVFITYVDVIYMCGGAILSEKIILTAAHCVYDLDRNFLEIVAGQENFNTTHKNRHKINWIGVYPDYNVDTRQFDVALLQLQTPLKLNTTLVQSIDVADTNKDFYEGKPGTIVYWDDANGSKLSLQVELVLWRKCTQADIYSEYAIICVHLNKGACIGDDAGSLIVDNKLWGVVSLNRSCIDKQGGYMILTNLTNVKKWIHDHDGYGPDKEGSRGFVF